MTDAKSAADKYRITEEIKQLKQTNKELLKALKDFLEEADYQAKIGNMDPGRIEFENARVIIDKAERKRQ